MSHRISPHLYRVYLCLRQRNQWMTSAELATHAQVAPRTARLHATTLVREQIAERAATFPFGYRILPRTTTPYLMDLERAGDVFGPF